MAWMDEDGLIYLWSKIKNKFVAKESGKGLSTNDYTTTEKNKLSGIASGAEVNQNAFGNVAVGNTTIVADSETDTLTLVAGSNVTLTPDTTNDKITIAATDTTYSDMKGATSSATGTRGLVPAPTAGKQAQYLRGDGTWSTPTNTTYGDATQSAHGLMTAADKKKLDLYPATLPTNEHTYFLAYNGGKDSAPVWTQDIYSDMCINTPQGAVQDDGSGLFDLTSVLNSYALKSDMTGVYKYKGSVANASGLPTSGQVKGDVYNIASASAYGAAGANVAWDGEKWDSLGEIFTITAITNTQIDTICV